MYCIGGKGTMMKVDISVYCRILRHPETLREKYKLVFSRLSLFYFR